MGNNITACWITINRACNLKCTWCYAKSAENSQMDFSSIKQLLDFLTTMSIKNVIILGGEPTCSRDLISIISECKKRQIYSIVVTNGIRLADKDYLESLIAAGVGTINMSQKAHSSKDYLEVTGVDCYNKFLHAVRNVSQTGVDFVVSYVLTSQSIQHIPESMISLRECGAKRFSLGFCYDFEICRSAKSSPENPYILWNEFSKYYNDINAACEGKFILQMGLPICVADMDLINLMNERKQILTVCQLLRRTGLILDTDMSVIPCNAMFNYKLGKFGISFTDKDSFDRFWNSDELNEFYNRLKAAPSVECVKCNSWENCGGGCISNWFNYKFEELSRLKEESENDRNLHES